MQAESYDQAQESTKLYFMNIQKQQLRVGYIIKLKQTKGSEQCALWKHLHKKRVNIFIYTNNIYIYISIYLYIYLYIHIPRVIHKIKTAAWGSE